MTPSGGIHNLVTDVIDEHRVHRKYLDKEVPHKLLERVLMSAIRSPSSMNGQQVSYLVVRDKRKREQIASVCGYNTHIAQAPLFILFAMDFYRAQKVCEMQGVGMRAQDSFESLMVGSVDVGIALSHAIITAESLGLVVCPIGGVRINPHEISRLFALPSYTFGVVGLTLGYGVESPPLKPRLPYDILVHEEVYDQTGTEEAVMKFDKEMTVYGQSLTRNPPSANVVSWAQRLSTTLKEIPNPKVKDGLHSQGFKTSQ